MDRLEARIDLKPKLHPGACLEEAGLQDHHRHTGTGFPVPAAETGRAGETEWTVAFD
jgi:hypothetical protein